ncbi:MAG: hypothetical protein JW741_22430 [Sedimentisphaerales bacterium]|nr:hypothetical protein [Sedimentisphaerales bacterium]
MNESQRRLKQHIVQSMVMLFTVMAIIATVFCAPSFAQTSEGDEVVESDVKSPENVKYGLIAAAAAFGLGAIGAGIAISHVGAAAMGAVAEKPQIAGQALLFVALAEGLVIFGFITALMIIGKV